LVVQAAEDAWPQGEVDNVDEAYLTRLRYLMARS
jgi:hypothetical protein